MKFKKSIYLYTFFLTFIIIFITQANAANIARLNGKDVKYIKRGKINYIALDDMVSILGISVSGSSGIINLEGRGKTVKLMPGKRVAIVNSSFKTFGGPVRNFYGRLYVPSDLIKFIYGISLDFSSHHMENNDNKLENEAVKNMTEEVSVNNIESQLNIENNTDEKDTVISLRIDKNSDDDSAAMILEFNRKIEKKIRLKENMEGRILTITIPDTESKLSNSEIPIDTRTITSIKYINGGSHKVLIKIIGKVPISLKAYGSGDNGMKLVVFPKTPFEDTEPVSPNEMNDEIASDTSNVSISSTIALEDNLKENLDGFHTIIAIDPGHGGSDYGVSGEGKLKEKHIVMEVSSKLNKLFQKAGLKSYLTRNGDYFLKFDKRVEQINSKHPDILISIHCDGTFKENSETASGLTVFYYDPIDDEKEKTVSFNDNISDEVISKQVKEILKGKNSSEIKEESMELAREVEAGIKKYSKATTLRNIKGTNILLLKECKRVAIHIELGFLTNPIDSKLIEDPDYREKIVLGIFFGIKNFIIKFNKKGEN